MSSIREKLSRIRPRPASSDGGPLTAVQASDQPWKSPADDGERLNEGDRRRAGARALGTIQRPPAPRYGSFHHGAS